jgi:hypothetical protein
MQSTGQMNWDCYKPTSREPDFISSANSTEDSFCSASLSAAICPAHQIPTMHLIPRLTPHLGDDNSPTQWLYCDHALSGINAQREVSSNRDARKMDSEQERKQAVYRIEVDGQLDKSWSGWFSGMTLTFQDNISTLTGPVADQAALRGLLSKIWDLNLTLVSVIRLGPQSGE